MRRDAALTGRLRATLLCVCAVGASAAAAAPPATLPLARMPARASAASSTSVAGALRQSCRCRRIRRSPSGRSDRFERRRGARAQSPRAPPRRCFCWPAARAKAPTDLYVSSRRVRAHQSQSRHRAGGSARHGKSEPLFCDYPEDWQRAGDALPGAPAGDPRLPRASMAIACASTPRASRCAIWSECARRSGIRQIDLYGASYGTRVAELYMRRYPAHVHAVILDGVTYPAAGDRPRYARWTASARSNLIVARCRAVAGLRRRLSRLAATISMALRAQIRPAESPR